MDIVFELEEIPGGIFEKERVVLDAGAGEPDAGLLIEGQPFRLGLLQELLPRVFRQEYQAKVMRINALLRWQEFRRQMRHELMPREPKHDSVARLTTQRTTKSIDIETFRRRHIVRGKGQMKQYIPHENCPRTVGVPLPFHQPAAI